MTLQDLCDRSGISVRTIRFYITDRLLPGPEGRGSSTSYTEEHLLKLLVIRKLALLRLPLAQIRERLEQLGTADLARLLEEAESAGESEAQARSPKAYISAMLARAQVQGGESLSSGSPQAQSPRDLWRRIKLASGIELHVSVEAEDSEAEMIRGIRDYARRFYKQQTRRNK